MGATHIDWCRYDKRLGKERDAHVAQAISADMGRVVHQETVRRRRKQLGIESPFSSRARRWFTDDALEVARHESLRRSRWARESKCPACAKLRARRGDTWVCTACDREAA